MYSQDNNQHTNDTNNNNSTFIPQFNLNNTTNTNINNTINEYDDNITNNDNIVIIMKSKFRMCYFHLVQQL